ncbi:MAG: choice-of-anchor L domain-containing protein [Proteobacteria bacterium]|nr:choice-of-anchor L domain-containing protein [Pseudomonadota bacterium]
MSLRLVACLLAVAAVAACGPTRSNQRDCGAGPTNLDQDPANCGVCGNVCGDGNRCEAGACVSGICDVGAVEDCYAGAPGTKDVGPCVGGQHTCQPGGFWGNCEGEVVPVPENCGDGLDNNCNGKTDEVEDADGDGYTTCGGGDCCDSTECTRPDLVNPGAFDAAGNNLDDDCNGAIDDTVQLCDQSLPSDSTNALDFAKAIDICKTATMADRAWGVISGTLTYPDGTGTPDPQSHAIRAHFGTGVLPQGGLSLAMLSTGAAAGKGDTLPTYQPFSTSTQTATESAFPADFLAANGGELPNAPGCPPPNVTTANDAVMLTLKIRVPSNAKSFKLSSNFFSAEFPEYTCSPYNDFFVILLDSMYAGMPANPTDKNLAFYTPMGTQDRVPVGVNLGFGNTGLFTQCVNGTTGCFSFGGQMGTISTCTGTTQLLGTGFEDDASGDCDANSVVGGATGWLVTSGNVVPGEIITLRIAIWDTSDHLLDSLAVFDGFQWSVDSAQPGTVIF